MLQTVTIILICLLLSAFFSGMEIAFVASNRLRLEIDKKHSRIFGHIVDLFTAHPGQYITTILVGNNIALVIYSLNMTLLTKQAGVLYGWEFMEDSIVFDTLVSTVILIFTSEFLPKAMVRIDPNTYMRTLAIPVYIFYIALFPIARLSTWISVSLLRAVGLKLKNNQHLGGFDRVDLTNLVEEAADLEYEAENENKHEIKLFRNALDFSDLRVRDCMVPRVDIEAVEASTPIGELSARFIETKFSRVMVYEGSIDNIVGYVTAKSLFTLPESIEQILRKVVFVPESMPAQRLLSDMIKRRQSLAVVIDEFGGTAGMVSLEDALEEIFGEIDDEHDSPEMVEKQTGRRQWVFSCRLEVEYLNEKYRLDIPESDEYDTLAGYIIFSHNGIPSQGEVLLADDKEIKILKANSSRVELASVRLTD